MKPKIYVFKLGKLIKTGIFAILGIGMIAAIIMLLASNSSKPTYSPGTYSAQIILHNSPVSVNVTVSKHEIESVELVNMGETQEVFYPLFNSSISELADEIVAKQSTDIAVDSNYTVTGGIILDAVRMALEQAQNN